MVLLKHTVYIKARTTDTISSINKDIKKLDAKTIQLITDKIIEGVLGHMLEDIVIFETKREVQKKISN